MSKLHKKFLSEDNFNLLCSVMSSSVKGREYIGILKNEMNSAINTINIPENINKIERKEFIIKLNKAVLANVMKKLNVSKVKPNNGLQNIPQESHANISEMFPKREISLQERNMANIRTPQPEIHPNNNFMEFPQLPQFTRDKGVNNIIRENFDIKVGNDDTKQIDFSLQQDEEKIDPEARFIKMMQERQFDDIKINKDNKDNKITENKITENKVTENKVNLDIKKDIFQNNFFENTPTELFNPSQTPVSSFNNYSSDNHQNNSIDNSQKPQNNNLSNHPPNNINSNLQQNSQPEFRDIYFTVDSKYRNIEKYPSPFNFSLNIDEMNIEVVECLDVSFPKISEVFEEPFIWLCVEEWGDSNKGINVPEGALARLKLSSQENKNFVTLRPHVLERQIINNDTSVLTFRFLKSDGEDIEVEDIGSLENIKNIENEDIIYIKCYYGDVKNLNAKITNIKKKKEEISFNVSQNIFTKEDLIVINDEAYPIVSVTDKITIRHKGTLKNSDKVGILKKNKEGYSSENREDINYRGGIRYKELENKKIKYDKSFYFYMEKKKQVNIMFRMLQLI